MQHCKVKSQTGRQAECRQLCSYTVDWTGHPLTLLKLLHPIINRGHLLINGSQDLSSFSQLIASLVRIKKVRKKGYLADSSVHTYFKKLNNGDIDLEISTY